MGHDEQLALKTITEGLKALTQAVTAGFKELNDQIHGIRIAVVEFQHDEQARHERLERELTSLGTRLSRLEGNRSGSERPAQA
jgi:hypothetical protein